MVGQQALSVAELQAATQMESATKANSNSVKKTNEDIPVTPLEETATSWAPKSILVPAVDRNTGERTEFNIMDCIGPQSKLFLELGATGSTRYILFPDVKDCTKASRQTIVSYLHTACLPEGFTLIVNGWNKLRRRLNLCCQRYNVHKPPGKEGSEESIKKRRRSRGSVRPHSLEERCHFSMCLCFEEHGWSSVTSKGGEEAQAVATKENDSPKTPKNLKEDPSLSIPGTWYMKAGLGVALHTGHCRRPREDIFTQRRLLSEESRARLEDMEERNVPQQEQQEIMLKEFGIRIHKKHFRGKRKSHTGNPSTKEVKGEAVVVEEEENSEDVVVEVDETSNDGGMIGASVSVLPAKKRKAVAEASKSPLMQKMSPKKTKGNNEGEDRKNPTWQRYQPLLEEIMKEAGEDAQAEQVIGEELTRLREKVRATSSSKKVSSTQD